MQRPQPSDLLVGEDRISLDTFERQTSSPVVVSQSQYIPFAGTNQNQIFIRSGAPGDGQVAVNAPDLFAGIGIESAATSPRVSAIKIRSPKTTGASLMKSSSVPFPMFCDHTFFRSAVATISVRGVGGSALSLSLPIISFITSPAPQPVQRDKMSSSAKVRKVVNKLTSTQVFEFHL